MAACEKLVMRCAATAVGVNCAPRAGCGNSAIKLRLRWLTDFARRANVPRLSSLISHPNQNYIFSHPTPREGRIMIVTYAGRDAVDAAVPARMVIAGRVSRERSDCAQTNGAEADGEVVWS